jgi:hypothetical protein
VSDVGTVWVAMGAGVGALDAASGIVVRVDSNATNETIVTRAASAATTAAIR